MNTIASTDETTDETKIELHLTGFRNGEGRVAVSVFRASDAQYFPRKPEMAVDKFTVDLNGRQELTISTRSLPRGTYAIAVFHDENSDGKLATNFLGIPKEGFGFSNNPAILFGPPPFQRASFALGAADADVSIRLKYFL